MAQYSNLSPELAGNPPFHKIPGIRRIPNSFFTKQTSESNSMLMIIIGVFVIGYLGIALEHLLKINKTATALLTGAICWALYSLNSTTLLPESKVPNSFVEQATAQEGPELVKEYLVDGQFLHMTGEVASILFFLMGAMTIVELVDANEGFGIITDRIKATSKVTLLWIVGFLTFFLSAVLDNLTTTIVMVALLRKLVADQKERMLFAGLVVIAANAGGAWTVIGDVTTTMLWIKGKISTLPVMRELFLASLTCLIIPLAGMSLAVRGPLKRPKTKPDAQLKQINQGVRTLFLFAGLGGLLFVPVFKAVTHLPPFLGMMFSLSMLWILSEVIHKNSDEHTRSSTGLVYVLKKIDMSSVLFFLGILLAVGCLGATGTLRNLAFSLDKSLGTFDFGGLVNGKEIVAVLIGFVSAVVDNVPLVAAGIEMYSDPVDSPFWMLLAYCAGTGGSCLIIGSAAGVAAMGLEHINFFAYLRRISFWAVVGYLAGAAVFLRRCDSLAACRKDNPLRSNRTQTQCIGRKKNGRGPIHRYSRIDLPSLTTEPLWWSIGSTPTCSMMSQFSIRNVARPSTRTWLWPLSPIRLPTTESSEEPPTQAPHRPLPRNVHA